MFSSSARDRPIASSLPMTSSRDLRPRLRTFIISSSVLEIRSATVLMLARLRQLKLRTDTILKSLTAHKRALLRHQTAKIQPVTTLFGHRCLDGNAAVYMQRIGEQTLNIRPVSFSFGKQSFSEPSFQQLEIVPLSSPALLAYLQERGINIM